MNKIGTAFHESFYLKRPSLAQILDIKCKASERESIGFEELYKQSSLGTNEVKAMLRYAYATGLVDNKEQPTIFGALVHRLDPGLSNTSTQWLLHYRMTAPYHNGPAFWLALIIEIFNANSTLTSDSVASKLDIYLKGLDAKDLAPRTVRTTASIFLNTYARLDGLGNLGVIKEDGNEYTIQEPNPIDWQVVAFVLGDYWDHVWPNKVTANYMDLMGEDGPAGLLLQNSGVMSDLLGEMRDNGLIEIERTVRPWQVKRLFSDTNSLLEKIYA